MLLANRTYPEGQLPPIAAVVLEAHHASERTRATEFNLEHERNAPKRWGSDLKYERALALCAGARERALEAGPKDSHGDQAATLLVMVDDLDRFLDGHWSTGGKPRLDQDEVKVLRDIRNAAAKLIEWHFENGAGALRPIAERLGLLHPGSRS